MNDETKNKEETKNFELSGIEKRILNLKPCKPGETHNPNGRPRGSNYKTRFKELLEKYSTYNAPKSIIIALKTQIDEAELPDKMTIEEAEAFRVHMAALAGEPWAYDRIHDKPAQAMDVTTLGDKITSAKEIFQFEIIDTIDKKDDTNKPETSAISQE